MAQSSSSLVFILSMLCEKFRLRLTSSRPSSLTLRLLLSQDPCCSLRIEVLIFFIISSKNKSSSIPLGKELRSSREIISSNLDFILVMHASLVTFSSGLSGRHPHESQKVAAVHNVASTWTSWSIVLLIIL